MYIKYSKTPYELKKTWFIYTDMRKFVWRTVYFCAMYLALRVVHCFLYTFECVSFFF
jgi:phage-related protein